MTGTGTGEVIVLDDGRARVEVLPEAGAAIRRYDRTAGGTIEPIFQTAPSPTRAGPFALGQNLLVPFSNRISGGGFRHAGVFHPLQRNTAGPYPIHGNGFTESWTAGDRSSTAVALTLASKGPGPFRYEAEVRYALDDGALRCRLTVTNRAATGLPYGAGFHPWFVRTAATRLTLHASGYWTGTPDHLPDTHLTAAGDPLFDFAAPRALPDGFTNCVLTGWTGRADLLWPDRGLGVAITAPPPLTTLVLYSPSGDSDFVCIEPVSHTVDAHNRTDAGTAPPQILEPGETLATETAFRPYAL